ncbi:MAG: hypothetical protein K1X79_06005 [Oligoflexia bacterium]|nr:hypothetical protein [Oligoflexia bacterium]
MSLEFSDQQRELAASFEKFLLQEVPSSIRRKAMELGSLGSGNLWDKAVEFGLPALFAQGDAENAGIRELALLAFESGKSLPTEALIESTLAGSFLIYHLLSEKEREFFKSQFDAATLDGIGDGSIRVALAPLSLLHPQAISGRGKSGVRRIDATLGVVADAAVADLLLFVGLQAETSPKLMLAHLKRGKEQQVVFAPDSTLDVGRSYSSVVMTNVACLGLDSCSVEKFRRCYQILAANELAGMCARVVSMTVEYVKTRKQFGAPIGSFQAVQHRLADMHVQSEAIRTLAQFAAWAEKDSPEQAALTAASAATFACEQAPVIIEGAIQLHGGIGFTWEFDLHLYLRRARMLEACCGGLEYHSETILESAAKNG